MSEVTELLDFAKDSVLKTADQFLKQDLHSFKQVTDMELRGREVKIRADKVLESMLLNYFSNTNLPILSEESGWSDFGEKNSFYWVIDPLDGSINFSRGLGPYAISVALWKNQKPVFGVLFRLDNQILAWGGKDFGAYANGERLQVSSQSQIHKAVLCTGVAARFQSDDLEAVQNSLLLMLKFAKLRMIGSAACSLLMVAQGSADAYFEDQIMLWDVAAGLALVEGAGGSFYIKQKEDTTCQIIATNRRINHIGNMDLSTEPNKRIQFYEDKS